MGDIQSWGIGIGAIVGVAIFAKFLPTQKIGEKIFNSLHVIGGTFSKMLLRYIPARSAEKIETGIFNTLLYWAEMAIKGFRLGMLEDNITHKQKKGGGK